MPIYEYECSHCRYYLEVIQKISDAVLKRCPSCGKNTLRKLISAPVFRLKGSGWYETDFKSEQEQRRNLAAAEKEEAATDTKEEKGKSETAEGSEAKAATAADAGSEPKAPATEARDATKSAAVGADRSPASKPGKAAKPAARGRSGRNTRTHKVPPKRPAAKAKRAPRRGRR